ncbi:MAG: class I SAM-dependent methyltransferase [bacterium]
MNEQPVLELLFDIFEDSIKKIYQIEKGNYLDLICKTAKNLSEGEILIECSEEDEKYLEELYAKVSDIDFNVEDIRKCVMLHVLRAFKEQNISYAYHTPDKISQIMSFIAVKLVEPNKPFNLLDPFCGTGNLLFTFLNNLNNDNATTYACDIDSQLSILCSDIANLLDYQVDVYNQDCKTSYFSNMDLVISDLNDTEDLIENISYNLNTLKENGYMVLLTPQRVLSDNEFKTNLLSQASLLGVINFDKELFKNDSKTILIIKKELNNKNCLLMEIPSFDKKTDFTKKILELQNWLERKR